MMKRKEFVLVGVILFLCFFHLSSYATVINIPGQYSTIQAGIDNASAGDTILVASGTYIGEGNRDIDFGGKQLVVMSAGGAAGTILNCESESWGPYYRGFIFQNGEDTASKVIGFTIFKGGGTDYGGGIFCTNGSSPTIANCMIDSGYANLGGGGIACTQEADPYVINCRITNCLTDYRGAAIAVLGSSPTFRDCFLYRNYASEAAGIYCLASYFFQPEGICEPVFYNCILDSNYASYGSAIMSYDSANPAFYNCTFYQNSAMTASLLYARKATASFENCITMSHTDYGTYSENGVLVYCDSATATPSFDCCDHYNNDPGNWNGCISGFGSINGNFTSDPLFCDAENDDFNLQVMSSCLPGGNSCGILIGAGDDGCGGYEGPYWYVATDGDDITGNGSSITPFATIQKAIDMANTADIVYVLSGTYSGPGNRDIDFKGKSILVRSDNGADHTFIDCDSARGFLFDDNEDTTSVLDGFTIFEAAEEAIYCDGSSPLIQHCILEQSVRGIICRDSASPIIRYCDIQDNEHPDGYEGGGVGVGAGVYCISGIDPNTESNPVFEQTKFINNRASFGAAVYTHNSQPEFRNCLFLENGYPDTMTSNGGAVYVADNDGPYFYQCTFYGNLSSTGSVVGAQLTATVTFENCIMSYNQVRDSMGQIIYCQDYADISLLYCDIYGNTGGDITGCIDTSLVMYGNFSAEPIFCDTTTDLFTLHGHSPCVRNSPLNLSGAHIGAYEPTCEGPVWIVATDGDDVMGVGSYAEPFRTIQRGVDACGPGDTVMMREGEYTGFGNRNVTFIGNNIVITSYYGADSTTINLENNSRAFELTSGEDTTMIIRGLTIRGASEAAIYCDSASPTITECWFMYNIKSIDLWGSSDAHINSCFFVDNAHTGLDASGVNCHFSSPIIELSHFEGNRTFSGGAIYAAGEGADPLIRYCLFIKNGHDLYQTSHGAAIEAFMDAYPQIEYCTFFGNQADYGPALYTQDADMAISNSIIAYNLDDAPLGGGPTYCLGSSDDITVSCSNVFGNRGGDYTNKISGDELLNNNISANPLFCDTATGHYSLAANSLCLGANNNCGMQMGAVGEGCADIANTPVGSDVPVAPCDGFSMLFENVTTEGNTDVIEQTDGPAPPSGIATMPMDPQTYYNIVTTADYNGEIVISLEYDEANLACPEYHLSLYHHDGVDWIDITTSRDIINNIITGITTSLSPFIMAQDTANEAPGLFSRLEPVDSSSHEPVEIDFVWNKSVDPDTDPVTYLLNIQTNALDTTIELSDTLCTFDFGALGLPEGDWGVNWGVVANDTYDSTVCSDGDGYFVLNVATGVDDQTTNLPTSFALHQNYPNPFNPTTDIRYELPVRSTVTLEIYNITGQLVKQLVNESQPAGYYTVSWDGLNSNGDKTSSGIYLYRLVTETFTANKKMLLLK